MKSNKNNLTFSLDLDLPSFLKKLHEFIDSDYGEEDNQSFKKRLRSDEKKYFGRIGEDFFITQRKRKFENHDTIHACQIKVKFTVHESKIVLDLNFKMIQKRKNSMLFIAVFSVLWGIMGLSASRSDIELLMYFLLFVAGPILSIFLYNASFDRAKKRFILDFNNLFDL